MTETDKLRRMLDERGVEWGETDTYRLFVTSWNDASGHSWVFVEYKDGNFSKLTAYHLTPEQAIAATLGEADEGYYLVRDGKKFPVELDYGFIGIMPIAITVGGFRYLLEVPELEVPDGE